MKKHNKYITYQLTDRVQSVNILKINRNMFHIVEWKVTYKPAYPFFCLQYEMRSTMRNGKLNLYGEVIPSEYC